ncbi:hypothetical protein TWF696_003805 [Orbilia brochopaga]|uniref:Uncharacterized protein n=1 Tax=Orbilia brochopaga TaxID=3140254 RepID=A0AAV9V788_9PEZI
MIYTRRDLGSMVYECAYASTCLQTPQASLNGTCRPSRMPSWRMCVLVEKLGAQTGMRTSAHTVQRDSVTVAVKVGVAAFTTVRVVDVNTQAPQLIDIGV